MNTAIAMTKRKTLITIVIALAIIFATLVATQFMYVRKAHSTFDNYYAFRGCQRLISKTETLAVCRLSSGKDITMVQYQNKWYLEGDLPVCWLGKSFCL